MKHLFLLALLAAVLAACAPQSRVPEISREAAEEEARKQREIVILERMKVQNRLRSVDFAVRAANVDLCKEKAPAVGFLTMNLDSAPREYRAAYGSLYGVTRQITLISVFEGGPADRAGLAVGDRIVSANGTAVAAGSAGQSRLAKLIAESKGRPLDLTVRRGGGLVPVELSPRMICNYPTFLRNDDGVNAFADGSRIVVTSGLMRFAEADDELAFVIGHELAHNTMGHIEAKTGNMILGGIVGAILTGLSGVNVIDPMMQVGMLAFSQEFEAEADYVGVYYAARAGYDAKKAAYFWRRMAAAHPSAIGLQGTTHPSSAKRFLAVEAASREIAGKQAKGAPLIPYMNSARTPARKPAESERNR
ncbi:MAG: M48 family metalloprotease [Rhodospirillaceae bacterium]|nr:M48 family metalloprotease [Rhodospirillaceae bacterium]